MHVFKNPSQVLMTEVQAWAAPHLPVLVLWLEGHQGAFFAARKDVLRWGAVNLLHLVALLLSLTTICNDKGRSILF